MPYRIQVVFHSSNTRSYINDKKEQEDQILIWMVFVSSDLLLMKRQRLVKLTFGKIEILFIMLSEKLVSITEIANNLQS